MKLSVHLVAWNGAKYIPFLFDSLRKQNFRDFKLLILDNGSVDETVKAIEKELAGGWCEYKIIQSDKNLGFAGGHNQLWTSDFRLQTSDYVLLLNQDMYLMNDCLEKLVKFMDEHPDAAAISPRLMKWGFPDGFTNKIDSLGFKVFRNRRVIENGAGKLISNIQYPISNFIEVFGVSGALPMFRKSVIDKAGLFDESFGSYKEDVDLAFRLRSAGFKSYVVLDAVAYHDRSASGLSDLSDKTAMENKKKQSEWVKYNSYKNHLLTLYKNEYWQNFPLDFPWIFWYELKKFAYFLIFDRKVLRGLGEIWKLRKDLKIKRLEIKKLRKIEWREMRKWFV